MKVLLITLILGKEKELGRRLTPAEYENIHQVERNHYMDQMQDAAKFGKISAAVAAFLTQNNVEVAAATGANAINHNFLMLAAYGVMVGSVGYSAYCVYTALEDGGPLAALQQLGIEIAVNAAGFAAGKFIIKSGAKILTFDCVQHAMEHVFKHTPGLQSALGHLTEKITSGITKLDQTALGQAANKLEAKLMQAEDKIFRRIFDPQTVKVRDVQWGKGIHEQGMPFEDYMGTKLPQGSRLPENFKTFDYFDDVSKRAISVKTLDTGTVAKLENPQQIYGTLKRNIDAVINFEHHVLNGREILGSKITSRELHLGIPHDILPTQRVYIDRAIDYAKLNGIRMEVFHVY